MFNNNLKNLMYLELFILLLLYPFYLIYGEFTIISLLASGLFGLLNIIIIALNYFSKSRSRFVFISALVGLILAVIMYFLESSLFDKADLNITITTYDLYISTIIFLHVLGITTFSLITLLRLKAAKTNSGQSN